MSKISECKKFFGRYTRPYQHYIAILIFLTAASLLSALITPLILRTLIDDVFSLSGEMEFSVLTKKLSIWLAFLLLTFIISSISMYFYSYFSGKLSAVVSNDIREGIFGDLNLKSLPALYTVKSGDVISRIMNDIVLSQEMITTCVIRFFSGIMGIALPLIIMLAMKWDLTLICITPMALYALLSWAFGKRLREKQGITLREMGTVSSFLREGLSIFPLVKVSGLEDYQKGRFGKVVGSYCDASINMSKTTASYISLAGLNIFLPIVLIFGVGGYMTIVGTITLGTLVAFSTYVIQFFGPIRELADLWPRIKMSEAAFDRVREIVDMEDEGEMDKGEELIVDRGRIDFKDLTFSYDGKPVLSDFNATFEKGLNFLVGDNGTGKTTLLHLIVKLNRSNYGKIEIDGKDIDKVSIKSLRKNASLLSQDAHLLDTTVYDNILIGNLNSSEDDVIKAARLANAHEFISNLPNGYQTQVGENGRNLSGGEGQKIALARAILKNSKIMLLDEVAKSIDEPSKKSIYEALMNLSRDKTIMLTVHELPGIDGRVVDLNEIKDKRNES